MLGPTCLTCTGDTAFGLPSTRQSAFNQGYLQVGRNGRFL